MRIKRNGERYIQDLSIQAQSARAAKLAIPSPTPHQMLLTHMQQALGYLDWFAPRCGAGDAMPVANVRVELKLLIEFLERNRS